VAGEKIYYQTVVCSYQGKKDVDLKPKLSGPREEGDQDFGGGIVRSKEEKNTGRDGEPEEHSILVKGVTTQLMRKENRMLGKRRGDVSGGREGGKRTKRCQSVSFCIPGEKKNALDNSSKRTLLPD